MTGTVPPVTAAQTHHHAPLGHEPQAESARAGAETLTWCGRVWTVLGRTELETWLRRDRMHLSVPHDLITNEPEQEQDNG